MTVVLLYISNVHTFNVIKKLATVKSGAQPVTMILSMLVMKVLVSHAVVAPSGGECGPK